MKKFLAIALSALIFAVCAVFFAACGERGNNGDETGNNNNGGNNGGTQQTVEADVYAPDGAPALALAQLMSEEMQFGGKVTYNVVPATTIQTYVTGEEPRAELCILPVNAAAQLLGTGEVYKMLGTVTHGNLYVLAAAARESLTASNISELLKGSKIGCLQLNNFVGYALRIVLDRYDIEYEIRQDKEEANNTDKAYIYEVAANEITPTASYDYMIAAEPAVSTKVANTQNKLQVKGDLQELYGENGYPQAVLVAKADFIEENGQFIADFIQAVAENAGWLLADTTEAAEVVQAVADHLPDGATPSFTAENLTKEVIENCAVRFDGAASCKERVNTFLAELSDLLGKTFSAADAFYYIAE